MRNGWLTGGGLPPDFYEDTIVLSAFRHTQKLRSGIIIIDSQL